MFGIGSQEDSPPALTLIEKGVGKERRTGGGEKVF
jgi:hypothetical protein